MLSGGTLSGAIMCYRCEEMIELNIRKKLMNSTVTEKIIRFINDVTLRLSLVFFRNNVDLNCASLDVCCHYIF